MLYFSNVYTCPCSDSCHVFEDKLFDSWWQQPQIAFCKDPIHHPGTRAASTDCSTRILGALCTKKDLNLWSVLGSPIGCHGIVHGWKCMFCQITPETTGQPKSSFVDDGTSLHGSFMTVTWSLLHVTHFISLQDALNWLGKVLWLRGEFLCT